MAGDLGQLRGQLGTDEANIRQFADPALPERVRQVAKGQFQPLLESSLRVSEKQRSDFLPDFFGSTTTGPLADLAGGTTAASLTPSQQLQVRGRTLGDLAGQLESSTKLSEFLGGKANEAAQRAQEALQYGNLQAAERYNRTFQRFQLALQSAEAARSRAAAAAQQQDLSSLFGQLGQQPQLTSRQQVAFGAGGLGARSGLRGAEELGRVSGRGESLQPNALQQLFLAGGSFNPFNPRSPVFQVLSQIPGVGGGLRQIGNVQEQTFQNLGLIPQAR